MFMNKKVVVMSGATSGFGVDWFQGMSEQMDASFYILARNEAKFKSLVARAPSNVQKDMHFIHCELSSLQSVAEAIRYLKTQVAGVDVLIHNAGIFPRILPTFNDDDIELTFVVNHLAPLLITLLLESELSQSDSPKVVNTSSFQHFNAKLNLDDINFKKSKFDAMLAYQNSKLCITLSTRHLATHLSPNITITCFDPGIVDTSMTKDAVPKLINWAYPVVRFFFRDGKKGAETGIYLSLSENEKLESGGYYKDKILKQPSNIAKSLELADQLHQLSMEYIEPYLS